MRKIMFSRESECIQPLRLRIEKQYHKTLVMWALDCAEQYLSFFELHYPKDMRPRTALTLGHMWARGEIKMPEAKKAIHSAHTAAAAVGDKTPQAAGAMAAARAVAHAAAAVHVETHALGVVLYGLSSKYYATEKEERNTAIADEIKRFYDKLLFWEEHIAQIKGPWANFLRDETLPNKEFLLRVKREERNK